MLRSIRASNNTFHIYSTDGCIKILVILCSIVCIAWRKLYCICLIGYSINSPQPAIVSPELVSEAGAENGVERAQNSGEREWDLKKNTECVV